jgi:SAM-dependent methyltransferase
MFVSLHRRTGTLPRVLPTVADLDSREALNLGCGKRYDAHAVNLDVTPDTSPDVVHDLDETPWPFPDDRFSRVEAIDVIEHLADPLSAMAEIHRILRPGGRVLIALPHFSSSNAFTDLTHRGYFGYFSFDYVTGEHEHDYYTRARFRMVDRQIYFKPGAANRLASRLAARYPDRYEQRWAWMFPAWFLRFELEALPARTIRA